MKIKVFSLLFILTFLLAACGNTVNPKDHLGEIYSVALDSIMVKDKELSSGMKFIAIDMSNFEISEKDKKEILNFFKDKYKLEIMDATFDELKAKGYYNPDTTALDGVLLSIDKVRFKFNNNVYFEASKHRSGLGAIGEEGTVHYKDGNWKIKESKTTWVS